MPSLARSIFRAAPLRAMACMASACQIICSRNSGIHFGAGPIPAPSPATLGKGASRATCACPLLAPDAQPLFFDLLAQFQDALDQRFGARWAAGHIDIHRDERVDALHRVVAVIKFSTGVRALA